MAINTKPIWELPTYEGNMPSDNDIIPIIDVDGDAHDSNTWKPEDGYENAKTRKMTIGSVKEQMLNMTGQAIAQWGKTMMESLTGYSPDKVTPTPETTSRDTENVTPSTRSTVRGDSESNVETPTQGTSVVKETALAFLLNHLYTYLNDKDHKIIDLNGVYDWLLSAFNARDFSFSNVWDQYVNTDEDGLLGQMRDAAAEGVLGLNDDTMHLLSLPLALMFRDSLFKRMQDVDDNGNIIVSGYFYHRGVDPSTTATDTLDLTNSGAYISNDSNIAEPAPWKSARVGDADFDPTQENDNGSKKINKLSVKGGFLNISVPNPATSLTSPFNGIRERKRYFLINDWTQNQGPLYTERATRVFRPSVENNQVSVTDSQLTSVCFNLNTSESIPSTSNTQVAFDTSDPVSCNQFPKLCFEVLEDGTREEPANARWDAVPLFTNDSEPSPGLKSIEMFKLHGFNDKYKLERFTKEGEATKYIRPDDVDSMSQMYALNGYTHEEDQPVYLHEARYVTDSWDYYWGADSDTVTQINSYTAVDPTQVVADFQSMVCFINNTDSTDKRYVPNVQDIIDTVTSAWAATYTRELDVIYHFDRIEQGSPYPTIFYAKDGEDAFSIDQVYIAAGGPIPTVAGLALTPVAISFEDESVANNTPFLKAVSWYGWDFANLPELLNQGSGAWTNSSVSAPGTNVVWSYDETVDTWSLELKYIEQADFKLFPRVADQTTEDPMIRQAISDNIVMFDGEHYAVYPYIYTAGTPTTTLLDQTYWADELKNMSTVEFGAWVIAGAINSIKNFFFANENSSEH